MLSRSFAGMGLFDVYWPGHRFQELLGGLKQHVLFILITYPFLKSFLKVRRILGKRPRVRSAPLFPPIIIRVEGFRRHCRCPYFHSHARNHSFFSDCGSVNYSRTTLKNSDHPA